MSLSQTTTAPPDDEPILATIVPRAPSPWQFGLKSLLGLMAVCGVQFALMRYLTILGGLAAAVGICFLALAVLLVWAVLFVRSRSALMEKLDFVGIRLVVAITVLMIGTIIAASGTAVYGSVAQMWMAMDLEQDLGIRTMRTEVYDSKRSYRALKVLFVYPGSAAQKVGIKRNEVIVIADGTIDQFYENMQGKRGQLFPISVAPPPVAGSIEKNPPQSINIFVPK